jgi:structure-specific endonuclease subunit SLX1
MESENGSSEQMEENIGVHSDKNDKQFFVYLLESSTKGATYVGATVNLIRRLRQHNKEIKGGANYTGMKVSKGETWRRVCYVCGFPDWRSALQFEWRWKQITRKVNNSSFKKPIERRMEALKILLSLDKSTSSAIPYSEWLEKPSIVYE